MNRPYKSYEGVAFGPGFLCGTAGIWCKRGFARRILAARIRPTLGSTCNFWPIILGTRHELLVTGYSLKTQTSNQQRETVFSFGPLYFWGNWDLM